MRRKKQYYRPYEGRRKPAWLLALLAVVLVLALGFVVSVTGQPQVMVILGCKVESWGPSVLLQDRLDKALDYLEDHPDLTIDHGVDGDQILLEDRSHNTWENIRFTQELLEQEGVDASQVVVVSNGFHLTRVRMLWGRVWEGEYTLSTLAAPSSHVPSRLKMYIREPLALVKSYFFDR